MSYVAINTNENIVVTKARTGTKRSWQTSSGLYTRHDVAKTYGDTMKIYPQRELEALAIVSWNVCLRQSCPDVRAYLALVYWR